MHLNVNPPKKIAYISETSPENKHSWSGTVHYVYAALKKQGHTVYPLGPAEPKLVGFFCKIINQLSLLFLKKRFDYRHSVVYSKAFGKIFSDKLQKLNYDLVVVCGGTEYAAYLTTTKPVFIIVDRTIEGAINYHPILTNLLSFSEQQSIFTDKKAMLNSAKTFFASEWAALHAKVHYGLPDSKSSVLPFGANLDKVPAKEYVLEHKLTAPCKLLFIGTNWKNKGADIAINTLHKLLASGVDAYLTLVGSTPETAIVNDRITVIPFVNKNNPEGLAEMEHLYLTHQFFILPTRFEAYGIVFCEASAYGVISIATNTGGIPGVVKEGINGYLISAQETDGDAYAKKIKEIFDDKDKLKRLSISARDFYEQHLNWESWAHRFEEEISKSFN